MNGGKPMKRRIIIGMLIAMAIVATATPVRRESIRANAQQEESLNAAARGRNLTLFGMIGLGRGQTARLNVVNLRSVPALEPATDQVITLVPCTVRLRFLDQRGNTIARSVEHILPGNGAFLDLPFHEAIPRGFEGKRIEIRAIVRALSPPEDERRSCATLSTLEIFDSETGRTSTIYPESPR
jgi:hypothetical protein